MKKRQRTENSLRCIFCGGKLCFESQFMASEIFADFYDDDTAIVYNLHCMNCGRSYEIVDPQEEEREKSYINYWK